MTKVALTAGMQASVREFVQRAAAEPGSTVAFSGEKRMTTTTESVRVGRVVHRQGHQHIEVNITGIGSGGASLLGGACLANPGKVPLEIIEVQSGSYLGEDDIVRFNDTYGRT